MDIKKLSREDALKLHREMWSDMQRDLGNTPGESARLDYKSEWCDKKFPDYNVAFDCFLCEYADQKIFEAEQGWYDPGYDPESRCEFCPIDWRELSAWAYEDGEVCKCFHRYIDGDLDDEIYRSAPISEILALPERK